MPFSVIFIITKKSHAKKNDEKQKRRKQKMTKNRERERQRHTQTHVEKNEKEVGRRNMTKLT